jgi:hypothetical protein
MAGSFFRRNAILGLNTNAGGTGIPGVRVQRRRKNLIKDYNGWPQKPVTELTISARMLVEVLRGV